MKYIALLQTLHLGKFQHLKANDLQYLFESLGFSNVETYLQNGNIIFDSNKEEQYIRKSIEKDIIIRYRNVVPVIIRTIREFQDIYKNSPYPKLQDDKELYVIFLKEECSDEKRLLLNNLKSNEEAYKIINREIYLLLDYGKFRFSNLVRNITQIDIHATIRDWTTIKKIYNKVKNSV